jgi:hypothetical protein
MNRLIPTVILLVLLAVGCGEGKKEEADANKEFRIPDSLLSPLDGYRLTRDDYHPVTGGIMESREIVLHYPASEVARYIAVEAFGAARDAYRLTREEIGPLTDGRVVLIGASDLEEYRFLTRKEWWYYGVVRGDTIYFEPFDIMLKRTILKAAVTQKIAQMALGKRSGGRIPLWMKEGLASRLADEWPIIKAQRAEFTGRTYDVTPSPERIEAVLEAADDRPLTRIAFYSAYIMVDRLVQEFGMECIMTFLDLLGDGRSIDEASREAFGIDYASLLDMVRLDGKGPAGRS